MLASLIVSSAVAASVGGSVYWRRLARNRTRVRERAEIRARHAQVWEQTVGVIKTKV